MSLFLLDLNMLCSFIDNEVTILKKYLMALFLSAFLCGCSYQVAGFMGSYQEPSTHDLSCIARLTTTSDVIKIISVDGKSTYNNSLALMPGTHEITFYIGSNNYTCNENHLMILSADFKAYNSYLLKSKKGKAWIEDASGVVVSCIISDMHISKSVEL